MYILYIHYKFNQMFNSNKIFNPYTNQFDELNIFENHKYNIIWILLNIFNILTNKYISHVLSDLISVDYCAGYWDCVDFMHISFDIHQTNEIGETHEIEDCPRHWECDNLLDVSVDKNDFVLDIIWYFLFAQIFILIAKILSPKSMKNFWLFLTNTTGIIYLTTSLWNYSLIWLYHYDTNFVVSFKKFMGLYPLFESIRLITYYNMIGELIILCSFTFILLLSGMILFLIFIKYIFDKLIRYGGLIKHH